MFQCQTLAPRPERSSKSKRRDVNDEKDKGGGKLWTKGIEETEGVHQTCV